MRMAKIFRNQVIKSVEEGGLTMTDCKFAFEEDGSTRITHKPSGSYLLLEGGPADYEATAIIGEGPPGPFDTVSIMALGERVQRWAKEVKRDVDTPDLWAELQQGQDMLTGARYEDVENTPFTPDEQAELTERLLRIEEYVTTTYSPSESQTAIMQAGFAEVRSAIRDANRMTVYLAIMGLLTTLALSGIVPPDAVHGFFVMVLHGLDHFFFGGGGTPLQLPPFTPPS